MKFIFAIQGEGRGHFTQALVMQEILQQNGDEVVAVLVGKSKHRELPSYFTEKMSAPIIPFTSPNFAPSASGKRPSVAKTIAVNIAELPILKQSMELVRETINSHKPDIVINFYELVTGLTYGIMPPNSPMVCIAHQYLFLHKDFKFPAHSFMKGRMLRLFTHLTSLRAKGKLALSFYHLPDDNDNGVLVIPPLMRNEVRELESTEGNYIHGYMLNSGYIEEIEKWHKENNNVPLDFFWDKKDAEDVTKRDENYTLHKINDTLFLERMAGCMGYATTAGFESVCEAIYLGKPILMVPAHMEQECNAIDAQRVGAGITANSFDLSALIDFIPSYKPNQTFKKWVDSSKESILSHLKTLSK